jgi:hypothetical protein
LLAFPRFPKQLIIGPCCVCNAGFDAQAVLFVLGDFPKNRAFQAARCCCAGEMATEGASRVASETAFRSTDSLPLRAERTCASAFLLAQPPAN